MEAAKKVYDLEQFYVDGSCTKYDGDDGVANFRLWKFISNKPRSRQECRDFFKSIGVKKNLSQRTSSAINWLRSRSFVRSNRQTIKVREVHEKVPVQEKQKPYKTTMSSPLPRNDDGNIDMESFHEIMRERQGRLIIGPPQSMAPDRFVEEVVQRNPTYMEGHILCAARASGTVRWDHVRDVIHKAFPALCDCKNTL